MGSAPIRTAFDLGNLAAMGNSLLDFVVALVRDPAAAARYAADPAGTLAAAGLPGVTVADVQNLMPMVTDSLAAASPGFGGVADAANVWTGAAAAAAFDAFDIHVPGFSPESPAPAHIDQPVVSVPVPKLPAHPDPSVLAVDDTLDQSLPADTPGWADSGADAGGWEPPHLDGQPDHHPGDPGFDLY